MVVLSFNAFPRYVQIEVDSLLAVSGLVKVERSVLEGKGVISSFCHVCGETEHVLEQVVAQQLCVKLGFLFFLSYNPYITAVYRA